MLRSDCTATSGAAPTTARKPDTMKAVGIAGPSPMTSDPEIHARTTRIACIASTGTKMIRVLASRATPSGQNIIE